MNEVVSKNVQRAVQFLQHLVESKEPAFQYKLNLLAEEFARPKGPSFSYSGDLTAWRELQTQLTLAREFLELLQAVQATAHESDAKLALNSILKRKAQSEANFKRACQEMARVFRQAGGPSGISSAEGEWVIYRAEAELHRDLADCLYDAYQALGIA